MAKLAISSMTMTATETSRATPNLEGANPDISLASFAPPHHLKFTTPATKNKAEM
jgi:hypothetical protein